MRTQLAAIALLLVSASFIAAHAGQVDIGLRTGYNLGAGVKAYDKPLATASVTGKVGDYNLQLWQAVPANLHDGNTAAVETDVIGWRTWDVTPRVSLMVGLDYYRAHQLSLGEVEAKVAYRFGDTAKAYVHIEEVFALNDGDVDDTRVLHVGVTDTYRLSDTVRLTPDVQWYGSRLGIDTYQQGVRASTEVAWQASKDVELYVLGAAFGLGEFHALEGRTGIRFNF